MPLRLAETTPVARRLFSTLLFLNILALIFCLQANLTASCPTLFLSREISLLPVPPTCVLEKENRSLNASMDYENEQAPYEGPCFRLPARARSLD